MNAKRISQTEFEVESESDPDKVYLITYQDGAPKCNCPAFIYKNKGELCKHIRAVENLVLDEEISVEVSMPIPERANVDWVTEERKILVPLIPLGWEWTDDYMFFIIADLAKLGYTKKQIVELMPNSLGGLLEETSLTMVIRYTEALGENRRNHIDQKLKEIRRNKNGNE